MKKDVFISITGIQGAEGVEDSIEFSTLGSMESDEGGIRLCYDESKILGADGIITTLNLQSDGSAVLERSGSVCSRLILQPGRRNNCIYGSPHGDFMIGIYCDFVKNELGENGGKVEMSYTLDSNFREISKNNVTIIVKEV